MRNGSSLAAYFQEPNRKQALPGKWVEWEDMNDSNGQQGGRGVPSDPWSAIAAELRKTLEESSSRQIEALSTVNAKIVDVWIKLVSARDPSAALSAQMEMGCCMGEAGAAQARTVADIAAKLHQCHCRIVAEASRAAGATAKTEHDRP
jgi:hypothetical protein